MAWEVVPAALAFGSGDEQHPGKDQTPNGPPLRRDADRDRGGTPEPRPAGLGQLFRHGNSARKFAQIDGYVHERLAILACNKHGLSARKWVSRFNGHWLARLGVHTLKGTIN